jgi:S-adenosylmethionine:tRNA ribosyltransferase-isomerase
VRPASEPRAHESLRLLVVEPPGDARPTRASSLPWLLAPGDLLVVNDAATLPASLFTTTETGEAVELRFVEAPDTALGARAVVFGAGDYRTRTEDRPPPPRLAPGVRLRAGDLAVTVGARSPISPRLIEVTLALADGSRPRDRVWAALVRAARPVQYAHVPRPLALWDVQNVYAGAPWAVEMPSAGRALSAATLAALRARGVAVRAVTHAAGLSATGDVAIDARLPLPERWRVPDETARAVTAARARGGRVIAVGTSVVRALETAARAGGGRVAAGEGITDLILGPGVPRLATDAILTGVHDEGTSHFGLLEAFAPARTLRRALEIAEREGFVGHELGDAWLVYGARGSSARFAA